MVHAFAKSNVAADVEYLVYIFHHPENQHDELNDWEMRSTTSDLTRAMETAESLYESQGYRKVEVKQRLVDPKTEQAQDSTLKVFSIDQNRSPRLVWCTAFGLVFALAGTLYSLVAYFHLFRSLPLS